MYYVFCIIIIIAGCYAVAGRRLDIIFGGTQTGSYQTGSYQKGRFIPPKPMLLYLLFFDTTPFICLWIAIQIESRRTNVNISFAFRCDPVYMPLRAGQRKGWAGHNDDDNDNSNNNNNNANTSNTTPTTISFAFWCDPVYMPLTFSPRRS